MKTQVKILLIMLIIIIILIIISIFFHNKSLTGNIIKEQNNSKNTDVYMYTKGLCNESNFCQDNEITCKSNQTISVIPITGAFIQNPSNWQDPRPEEVKNKLC